ncbi:MAG: rhomboid family intramembrane serine protease [Myxococcota bacterium]
MSTALTVTLTDHAAEARAHAEQAQLLALRDAPLRLAERERERQRRRAHVAQVREREQRPLERQLQLLEGVGEVRQRHLVADELVDGAGLPAELLDGRRPGLDREPHAVDQQAVRVGLHLGGVAEAQLVELGRRAHDHAVDPVVALRQVAVGDHGGHGTRAERERGEVVAEGVGRGHRVAEPVDGGRDGLAGALAVDHQGGADLAELDHVRGGRDAVEEPEAGIGDVEAERVARQLHLAGHHARRGGLEVVAADARVDEAVDLVAVDAGVGQRLLARHRRHGGRLDPRVPEAPLLDARQLLELPRRQAQAVEGGAEGLLELRAGDHVRRQDVAHRLDAGAPELQPDSCARGSARVTRQVGAPHLAGYRLSMSRWFGSGQSGRDRGRYVNYRQHLAEEQERLQQTLFGLIAVNVLVFVAWQLSRGGPMLAVMSDNFTVSLEAVVHGRVWTLLTSEFSHYATGHLFFNMFALWVFGRGAGEAIGWRNLLALYGLGAVAASVAHVGLQLVTGSPVPALGASGAVMAIAVVYALLFPNRTLLLNFFIPVPAWVAVTGYVVLDVLGVFGVSNDGVAHAAHLGGAALGAAFWWWTTQRGRGAPRPR